MAERVRKRDRDEDIAHIIHDQACCQIHTCKPRATCNLVVDSLCLYTTRKTVGTETLSEAR